MALRPSFLSHQPLSDLVYSLLAQLLCPPSTANALRALVADCAFPGTSGLAPADQQLADACAALAPLR
eukprot:4931444-Alexandrium_andersonii.AAC.1